MPKFKLKKEEVICNLDAIAKAWGLKWKLSSRTGVTRILIDPPPRMAEREDLIVMTQTKIGNAFKAIGEGALHV